MSRKTYDKFITVLILVYALVVCILGPLTLAATAKLRSQTNPEETVTQVPTVSAVSEKTAIPIPETAPVQDTQPSDSFKVQTGELLTALPDAELAPEITEAQATAAAETEPPETVPLETFDQELYLHFANMPVYFQNDYPNVMYGSGTVAGDGCSVTSLAMVASYMTGYDYAPDTLAKYFGGQAENHIDRLEIGSDALGLVWEKAENWDFVYAALKEGKVAIVLMGSSSFTTTQHFIVLNGVTNDGKVMVIDPNNRNYTKWDLEDGLIHGFPTSAIWSGYQGGWIYDKSAMPEEVPFYEEPPIDYSNPRYPHIQLSDEDMALFAKVVWAEARGESEEGQQAVAEVIMNRLNSENFGDTVRDIVYDDGQFRTVDILKDAEPYQAQYEAIERAIYGPYILPENVMHFATFQTNANVWGKIGGHIFCYEYECN